jgi:geranyl-CoA carboxylase beta subunit
MAIVMEESARARGRDVDRTQLDALRATINATFERQTSAFYTSGRMLDDGVIDPRDTRRVLGLSLSLFRRAERVTPRPLAFGVARP